MAEKLTEKEIRERLNTNNPNVEMIGEYCGRKKHTKCRCKVCGNIWFPLMGDVLNGHGCPICGRENTNLKRMKSHQQFVNEMSIRNPNVKVLGEYAGDSKKIEVECVECSYKWYATPNNLLLKSSGCPNCRYDKVANKRRKDESLFKEQLNQVHHGNITCIDTYYNCKTKLHFKCNLCGNIWLAIPQQVVTCCQTGCPRCNGSKGEKKIAEYLSKRLVNYQSQYVVNYQGYKRFDFAILNHDNTVNCFIEYDGEQHFRPVDFAGKGSEWAKHSFEYTQERDRQKNEYCVLNNIPLLRIAYNQNIIETLDNWFSPNNNKGGNVIAK